MRNLLLLLTLLVSINFTYGQSQKPTVEQKQVVNPIIDNGFSEWAKTWRYDKYVPRSAKINLISVDEDYGDIEASGYFTYRRLWTEFTGTFVAKISPQGQLISITYTDADGLKGSKKF